MRIEHNLCEETRRTGFHQSDGRQSRVYKGKIKRALLRKN